MKNKYESEERKNKGQRTSTIDLMKDLKNKYNKVGGFYDWLRWEREEKQKENKSK